MTLQELGNKIEGLIASGYGDCKVVTEDKSSTWRYIEINSADLSWAINTQYTMGGKVIDNISLVEDADQGNNAGEISVVVLGDS